MANPGVWSWIEFPDTKCRDGSPAGIAINPSLSSENLMIFMEAGGACFDAGTCFVSPPAIASRTPRGSQGIFNRSHAENPVKDWSFVYVPYCTGDVHLGANDRAVVEGVAGTQRFVGRLNMEAFLKRIVPTFDQAQKVLVTGTSAGGFAASATTQLVDQAFGERTDIIMIDDSGPPMARAFLPECLTEKWRTLWKLGRGVIGDCGANCTPDGDYEVEVLEHFLAWDTDRYRAALLESDGDLVIRGFYGIGTNGGRNDCRGVLLLTPMDATLFRDALLDYRARVQNDRRYSTYYPPGAQHTWLESDGLYTTTVGEVRLIDWVTDAIEGRPGRHVGL